MEEKLRSKGIEFNEIDDIDLMIKNGFMTAPVLVAAGKEMEFSEANQWINSQEGQT